VSRKIPPDAFSFYMALGPRRSYEAVASKYGVTKRGVVKVAERERWQERLASSEKQVREKSESQVIESLAGMQARHLKTLNAVLARALEALRSMPLETSMEAVRAIEMVLRQERAIRSEGDESFAALEQRIRAELQFVMVGGEYPETGLVDKEASDGRQP